MNYEFGYRIEVLDGTVCAKVFIYEKNKIIQRAGIKFFSNPFHSLEKRLAKANKWVSEYVETLEKGLLS